MLASSSLGCVPPGRLCRQYPRAGATRFRPAADRQDSRGYSQVLEQDCADAVCVTKTTLMPAGVLHPAILLVQPTAVGPCTDASPYCRFRKDRKATGVLHSSVPTLRTGLPSLQGNNKPCLLEVVGRCLFLKRLQAQLNSSALQTRSSP